MTEALGLAVSMLRPGKMMVIFTVRPLSQDLDFELSASAKSTPHCLRQESSSLLANPGAVWLATETVRVRPFENNEGLELVLPESIPDRLLPAYPPAGRSICCSSFSFSATIGSAACPVDHAPKPSLHIRRSSGCRTSAFVISYPGKSGLCFGLCEKLRNPY
jgi:hypothetical protein